MDKIYCQDCRQLIKIIIKMPRKYIQSMHHVFCQDCLKDKQICSLSKCKKIFLINDQDFKNLKFIYIANPKNKSKFFLFNEVNNLVIQKYGSLEKLDEIKKQHKKKNKEKQNEKNNVMKERKEKLINILSLNKLEYKNYGDCYSYVKYGTPNIDEILKKELEKLEEKRNRKILLAKELSKINIPIDESLPSCYNYLNGIGCKNLKESVREIEIEHFFKNNSNYLKYLEDYDPGKAKDLASNEVKIKKSKSKSIKVCFD